MPTRSKQLWDRKVANTVGVKAYTVPAGETSLVKRLVIFNHTLAAVTLWVGRAQGLSDTSGSVLYRAVVGVAQSLEVDVWWALAPGAPPDNAQPELWVRTAAGTCTTNGFGAELEGVAD